MDYQYRNKFSIQQLTEYRNNWLHFVNGSTIDGCRTWNCTLYLSVSAYFYNIESPGFYIKYSNVDDYRAWNSWVYFFSTGDFYRRLSHCNTYLKLDFYRKYAGIFICRIYFLTKPSIYSCGPWRFKVYFSFSAYVNDIEYSD